jgi:hypothetical protein
VEPEFHEGFAGGFVPAFYEGFIPHLQVVGDFAPHEDDALAVLGRVQAVVYALVEN